MIALSNEFACFILYVFGNGIQVPQNLATPVDQRNVVSQPLLEPEDELPTSHARREKVRVSFPKI